MFFLNWNHFKTDNKKLYGCLGVERGAVINIKFINGFFIAPDDYSNRKSSLPKILLDKSIIEVFKEKSPKIVKDVETFYKIVGGFDRLNYVKLKHGAKLAYFFAASYYAYINNLKDVKLDNLFKNPIQGEVTKNQSNYLIKFVELAAHRNQAINLSSLFHFAVLLIKEVSPKTNFPACFNRTVEFLANKSYYPYGNILGSGFEETVQEMLEKIETHNESLLAKLVRTVTNENGVLFPLDGDEQFKNAANKKARGIKLPDYVFVSAKHICPVDLKANLNFANLEQVTADNLQNLFLRMEDEIRIIFSGLTLGGKFIEPYKQETKELAAETKSETPMQVLKNKSITGKDLGIISKLWKESKPITQELLLSLGFSHTDLGMVVDIFNRMLSKK